MTNIKKYTKKDGSTAYMFNTYLGVNPSTGKSMRTTRRGFKTQKEAKLALAQLQLEVESKGFSKKNYNTFSDVYDLWFMQYKNTVKKSTIQRVTTVFNKQILPIFGTLKIQEISSTLCQKAINDWNDKYSTYRMQRIYLKKVFNFAVIQGFIDINPLIRVVYPKKEINSVQKKKDNFLEKKQLKELLETIKNKENEMAYVAFYTLAFTGLRKGELYALVWNDLDFKNKTLSINKTAAYIIGERYISSPKTEESNRIISVDNSTLSILKRWKFEQRKELLSRGIIVEKDDEQKIFAYKRNELLQKDYINKILAKYPQFDITAHGLRHTHASLLFESGASLKNVQKRLGHKDIQTTMNVYTHVTKDAEKDTAINFEKYMNS